MSAQQQGESGNWLRLVWAVLNRPLFGTQPRPKPVWVEGRISSELQVMIPMIVVILLMGLGGFHDEPLRVFFGVIFDPIVNRMCEPGWGGYSLGLEILLVILTLFVLLLMLSFMHELVEGWCMYKRKRSVPLGYRPWFRTLLLEGRAAERRGVRMMIFSAACLLLMFGTSVWWVSSFSKVALVPPTELKKCNPSHSPKSASSESLAPIPQNP